MSSDSLYYQGMQFSSPQKLYNYKTYIDTGRFGPSGGFSQSPIITIELKNFAELSRELNALDREYNAELRKLMPLIARDFRVEAQRRSPYLYGVLKNAHRDAAKYGDDGMEGAVYLDPAVTHPILGGMPYDYGKEIHDEGTMWAGPRPWFAWTIEDVGDSIMSRYDSRIGDVFMAKGNKIGK